MLFHRLSRCEEVAKTRYFDDDTIRRMIFGFEPEQMSSAQNCALAHYYGQRDIRLMIRI
jgi:hypothetical protein